MAEMPFWDEECLGGEIVSGPTSATGRSLFEADLFCDEDTLDSAVPEPLTPTFARPCSSPSPRRLLLHPSSHTPCTPPRSFVPSALSTPLKASSPFRPPLPPPTGAPGAAPLTRAWRSFMDDSCPLRKRVKVTITASRKKRSIPPLSAAQMGATPPKRRKPNASRSTGALLQTTLCFPHAIDTSAGRMVCLELPTGAELRAKRLAASTVVAPPLVKKTIGKGKANSTKKPSTRNRRGAAGSQFGLNKVKGTAAFTASIAAAQIKNLASTGCPKPSSAAVPPTCHTGSKGKDVARVVPPEKNTASGSPGSVGGVPELRRDEGPIVLSKVAASPAQSASAAVTDVTLAESQMMGTPSPPPPPLRPRVCGAPHVALMEAFASSQVDEEAPLGAPGCVSSALRSRLATMQVAGAASEKVRVAVSVPLYAAVSSLPGVGAAVLAVSKAAEAYSTLLTKVGGTVGTETSEKIQGGSPRALCSRAITNRRVGRKRKLLKFEDEESEANAEAEREGEDTDVDRVPSALQRYLTCTSPIMSRRRVLPPVV